MEHRFQPGDVVRYTSEREGRWCREGMAIAEKRDPYTVVLRDTYWNSRSVDDHCLTEGEIATAELLFNVDDYDELDQYDKHGSETTWRKYNRGDRRVITAQHGLQKRWFIRKGAGEDIQTQISNAREEVAQRESEVASANRSLEWAREDLAKLIAESENAQVAG